MNKDTLLKLSEEYYECLSYNPSPDTTALEAAVTGTIKMLIKRYNLFYGMTKKISRQYYTKLIRIISRQRVVFKRQWYTEKLGIKNYYRIINNMFRSSYAFDDRLEFVENTLDCEELTFCKAWQYILRTKNDTMFAVLEIMSSIPQVEKSCCDQIRILYDKENIYKKICIEVTNHLSEASFIRALNTNKHYTEMFKKLKQNEKESSRLKEGILHKVPDSLPFMYPLAREMHRTFIIHCGPTNSGKSHDAISELKRAQHGVYLAPLRLLAYEKYEELNEEGISCSMKTGEEEIFVQDATVRASTIEIFDPDEQFDIAVIDEVQLIGDKDRGGAWTEAILGIQADIIHLCTAPEALSLIIGLINDCNDEYTVVRHERFTPLELMENKIAFPSEIQKGDCFIVFSRRSVHSVASVLRKKKISCSMIYGALPYDVRRNEARRFISGESDVVVATDAIGMGLNLPIRRICFLEETKFDGEERRTLRPGEILQIAGRAGRYGIYEKGYVAVEAELSYSLFRNALNSNPEPVKKAFVGFPISLIDIDGLLSKTMEQWVGIPEKDLYSKSRLQREIALCKELEKETEDKRLIYRFIMIPFDEDDKDLHILWKHMFICVRDHLDYRFEYIYYSIPNELSDLEHRFRIMDLLYYFSVNFAGSKNADVILNIKRVISDKIIKILETRKPEIKRCRICHRELPWNYPYGICSSCHWK